MSVTASKVPPCYYPPLSANLTSLDDYISQDALRALSGAYQKIAGFSKQDVGLGQDEAVENQRFR